MNKVEATNLAAEIVGLIGNHNNGNEPVCFEHIEGVLSKYNLSYSDALEIVSDYGIGSLSEKFDKVVVPRIIEKLKRSIAREQTPSRKKNKAAKPATEVKFTQRQVAIAYFFIDKHHITSQNYKAIMEKHGAPSSKKILQKLVTKTGDVLFDKDQRKTENTKLLNDLKAAERLLSGINDKEALTKINQHLQAFQTSFKSVY